MLFDVESVADGEAIAKTRYPDRQLSPAEAITRYRHELLADTGRDFIPYTYHIPVAVVVAKLRADFSLSTSYRYDTPEFRPHVITRPFGRAGSTTNIVVRDLQWTLLRYSYWN